MDAVLLARIQFALTIGFHFIFPPLSIGLSWLIVFIMTKYKNTGDDRYRNMAKLWIKLFALTFVIGVATGITMEFQFGTNWSEYSRFVGDIFGAPLAAEGIIAFFLESSFLAILLFGWKRVSVKVHWFSSIMVALGSTLSAFWIIVANSWQQTPTGYHIVNNRAELTNFFEAVFNPSTVPRFLHTMDGAMMTGAFFMLGISAWQILKGLKPEHAKETLKISLIVALISSFLQFGLGHYHAVQVTKTQPEKLAAIEGLFETQNRAPALIFGIPDAEAEKMHFALKLPGLLSLLAYGNINAEIKGLKDFPKEEWPPLALTFYPFHMMVGLGSYLFALAVFGFYLLYKKTIFDNHLFLRLAFWSIPLPFIANELGWITAEVGRQPWIVYHLLKTADAVSVSVPAYQILVTIFLFVLIYTMLFILWIVLLRHELFGVSEGRANLQEKGVAV
ncbi:cytochrome ubiquinol oxidase subunit I [bacterium]|nr:cytochrome ubiquinol oxidase subunit I [bacterium]